MRHPEQSAPASGQSRPAKRHAQRQFRPWFNISTNERWLSAVVGGALGYAGLRRGAARGLACAATGAALIYRAVTGHSYVYAALKTSTADPTPPAAEFFFERGIHVEQSVVVHRSARQLYDFWKNFENLPTFMTHLQSVRVIDEKHSHWRVRAPSGIRVEWDAQIINDEPPTTIAWRSLRGSLVDTAGSVRFLASPTDGCTEVRVVMDYIPPAGRLGRMLAEIFGEDPAALVRDELRKFKQVMEA